VATLASAGQVLSAEGGSASGGKFPDIKADQSQKPACSIIPIKEAIIQQGKIDVLSPVSFNNQKKHRIYNAMQCDMPASRL